MDGALLSSGKVKEKWDCVKEQTLCDDHQFPWPAKNYACNFCRREFKSAQALGGHMNVHRRDRARLRLLPSWVPENSCPNPNFYSPHPTFFSSTSSSGPQTHQDHRLCFTNQKHHDEDQEVQVVKKKIKKSLVNLELKMGIHHLEGSNEDGLDLELRL